MSAITREENGTIVTAPKIQPPLGWTNDYEAMGGEMQWHQDGEVSQMIQSIGVEGQVKPIMGMEAYTGEASSLFEVGDGQCYFYNAIEASIYQVENPSDLDSIIAILGDSDKGMAALDISQVG